MSGALTAVGVGVVSSAILGNQAAKAQEGAVNAQKKSINAATEVERERLAAEQRQYDQQFAEYQRKQAMLEKQQQQQQVLLAPYMQAGQGALYEMMALTGIAPPTGAVMPTQPAGLRTAVPAPAPQPGKMGIMSTGPATSLRQTMLPQPAAAGGLSPAAAELSKGGLSLSSKRWQMAAPDASPRATAAQAYQQIQAEMPNATPDEVMSEAERRLNSGYGVQQQQSMIQAAREQVPTIASAANPYAGMTGAQSQQTAIDRIAQSPLLAELTRQGEEAILQQSAATGGLRGGNIQGALAQYRPQMLQNEIDKMYGRLQGISGLGQTSILGAPTTAVGAAPKMNYQSQIPGLLTEAGAAQAGGLLGQSNAQQQMFGNIGQTVGWGLEKYGQGGFFPTQQNPVAAPQFAGLGIGNPSNY